MRKKNGANSSALTTAHLSLDVSHHVHSVGIGVSTVVVVLARFKKKQKAQTKTKHPPIKKNGDLPMALSLGTGFTIVPGAMSKIQDGGMGEKLSVPFNLSADPFIPDGTRINPDNETARKLKLARYFGGDESKWNWVAQGDYSETRTWRPGRVLRGFLLAWKAGHDVNSWAPKVFKLVGSPSDYSSSPPNTPDAAWPTVREQTDYEYAFTRDESQQWYEVLLDMGFIEDAPKPGEVGDTGANARPPKPIKQSPNTVPSVPPPVIPPINPIPPLVTPSLDTDQVSEDLDKIKSDLHIISTRLEDLHELFGEKGKIGKQIRTLVTRSKPERKAK